MSLMKSRCLALMVGAVGAGSIASIATSSVTSWTSPSGGSWHDVANWSAGVPTARDVAVLPALASGDYQIEIASDAPLQGLVVSGTVALTGHGTIMVNDSTDIGVGALVNGSLTLLGVDLVSSGMMRVGFDADIGELSLKGSASHLVANVLLVGLSGSATTSIDPTNTLTCSIGVLGPNSTLQIVVASDMSPVLPARTMTFGGALEVTFAPDLVPPILQGISLATPLAAFSGAFSSISTPEAFGQHVPVQMAGGRLVGPFDPVTEMTIEPLDSSVYVGFAEPLGASATRLSGATYSICCDLYADLTSWAIEPARFAIIEEDDGGRLLRGLLPGNVTLTLSYPQYGATLTTTEEVGILGNTGPAFEAIDVGPNGEEPNGWVWGGFGQTAVATTVRCSADGRSVAFADASTSFSEIDPSPGFPDVFVKNRDTGTMELVSAAANPMGLPVASADIDISSDGRFVTFAVFPYPPTEGYVQLWLHDRERGTTILVSRTPSGAPVNGHSWQGRISADGTTIVFYSEAIDLVSGDSNDKGDVFGYDVATGAIALVSVAADGGQASSDAGSPIVSADGRFVAFSSVADFGLGLPAAIRVWLKDRVTGAIELVSVATNGTAANYASTAPSMDASGQIIAFRTTANNLVIPNSGHDVYVRDRAAGTTTLVTGPSIDLDCATHVQNPCVSVDGRFVAFELYKNVGSPSDNAMRCAIMRFDRATGVSELVAVTPWGTAVPGYISSPALTFDGEEVFFVADPATLLPFGEDVKSRIFVRIFGGVSSPDLDRDGVVGPLDLGILLGAWGSPGLGDLDGDGVVGPLDLAIVLGAWT